jgi:hypothetical protein
VDCGGRRYRPVDRGRVPGSASRPVTMETRRGPDQPYPRLEDCMSVPARPFRQQNRCWARPAGRSARCAAGPLVMASLIARRKTRELLPGSNILADVSKAWHSDMARPSESFSAKAFALARMPTPSRTSSGSLKIMRSRFKAWLTAGWVTLSSPAARETLCVRSRASMTLRRLRSTLDRFTRHPTINAIHTDVTNSTVVFIAVSG